MLSVNIKILRKAFIGCVVACFGMVGLQAHAQQATRVEVDQVVEEPLAQTLPVLGRLVAQQKAEVAALVQGPVAAIPVQVGDAVKKGDLLLKVEDSRILQNRNLYRALLRQAEANLTVAKDAQDLTAQELDRLKKLQSSAAFSPARLDDKRLELASQASRVLVAEAAVAAAKVNLSLAQIDLNRTAVKAPFNGVVTQKSTEVGAYVNTGDAVVSLINYEDLEVEADIPSDRLQGLENGRLVKVALAGFDTFDASVRATIPEENALTRTRAVRFTLAVPENILRALASGQSATVYVPVGAVRQVVTIHKDALIARGAGYAAFVVDNGKAAPRNVRIGDAVGSRFEVLSGVNAGDQVVVRGNERLRPNQAVTYPGMPEPVAKAE